MTEEYVEELIRKYAEGTATADEIQKLMRWYRLTPINDVEWPSATTTEKEEVSQRMLGRLQKEISPARARIINFRWLKVAALVILSLGLSTILIYYLKPGSKSFITVTNPSGKIQLVNLPDSSRVWLNASTTLRYLKSFNQSRKVELEGEAYFEVTHDAQHPFVVDAGGVHTAVLGTSFNIKAYRPETVTGVSVITGKVRVTDSGGLLGVLTPAVHLQYDRQNRIVKTSTIDTNAVVAWTKGKLLFQGETFAEIARTLENWYGIKIIFTNPRMMSCRYYMSFDNTISLNKLLSIMSEITEMEYVNDEEKNIVTLSGKECR
jgi:transmembrane sensor